METKPPTLHLEIDAVWVRGKWRVLNAAGHPIGTLNKRLLELSSRQCDPVKVSEEVAWNAAFKRELHKGLCRKYTLEQSAMFKKLARVINKIHYLRHERAKVAGRRKRSHWEDIPTRTWAEAWHRLQQQHLSATYLAVHRADEWKVAFSNAAKNINRKAIHGY